MRSVSLILSVALHGGFFALASLSGPWLLRHAAEAAQVEPSAGFDGFHGNTVETEGLVEGELGLEGDDEDGTRAEQKAGTQSASSRAEADPEPKPAPRTEEPKNEKKKPRKRPRGHRNEQATNGNQGAGETNRTGSKGDGGEQFGTKQGGRGVKDLALAFTAAVPQAVSGDRAWSELPLGDAGTVEVALAVTDGKIVRTEVPDKTPAHLRRIVKRTLPLLTAGRYALGAAATGKERLRLAATISERTVDPPKGEERKVLVLGHDEPSSGKPGRAYFTLANGRHVEITVTVIR